MHEFGSSRSKQISATRGAVETAQTCRFEDAAEMYFSVCRSVIATSRAPSSAFNTYVGEGISIGRCMLPRLTLLTMDDLFL